jgi:hypothetical protein
MQKPRILVLTAAGKTGMPVMTLTRFNGVSERGNSLGLLLIGDRTQVSQ